MCVIFIIKNSIYKYVIILYIIYIAYTFKYHHIAHSFKLDLYL